MCARRLRDCGDDKRQEVMRGKGAFGYCVKMFGFMGRESNPEAGLF